MKINKSTATNLIKEISSILNYDINIMDESGTIIASTNELRLGQFHEGAHLIITQELNELLVFFDDEYSGCKKGINLPIIMNNIIIGVVGITGNVEEIYKYAHIIKKVTEILMKDIAYMQHQNYKEQMKLLFMTNWFNGEIKNHAEIEDRLCKYHIQINRPIVTALIKSEDPTKSVTAFFDARIDEKIILTGYNNDLGIMVGNFDSCEKFKEYIISCFNVEFPASAFIISIGSCCHDYEDVPSSYHQAQKIMALKKNDHSGIHIYNNLLLELIIDQVDKDYKKQFVEKIFGNCKYEDIVNFIDFIKIYYDCNGSINAVADKMFVHKNTVQYKINKIINCTNLDPRISSDLISLYLACQWFKSNKNPNLNS